MRKANSEPAGYFQALAPLAGCSGCEGARPETPLVDAVYCIALQEEDDRAQDAAAHFHAIGLCHNVTFYRPRRGCQLEAAVWASHRAVARHAVAHGHDRVLVLEDDVLFNADWATVSRRTARAIATLPAGWWGFFLGHWPLQGYFVARDVMRTRSATMHAYIAHAPLLEWLARTRILDPTVPMAWLGHSIDMALANLPGMYALFPMAATQRPPRAYRVNTRFDMRGSRRRFFEFSRHRYWIITHAMRPGEAAAALLSPYHWLSMRRRGFGTGQTQPVETAVSRQAKAIAESGLFDESYYAAGDTEMAAAGIDPLGHYMNFGDREGRMPNPLFDIAYYRREAAIHPDDTGNSILHYLQAGEAARKDPHPLFDGAFYLRHNSAARQSSLAPLPHYLRIGGIAGYSPHPCFDAAWYLAQYPDIAALADDPLSHYIKHGWRQGRFPHPGFDTGRYLAENPDVAAAGVNPLDHYVRHGRAEGRAPWFGWRS